MEARPRDLILSQHPEHETMACRFTAKERAFRVAVILSFDHNRLRRGIKGEVEKVLLVIEVSLSRGRERAAKPWVLVVRGREGFFGVL